MNAIWGKLCSECSSVPPVTSSITPLDWQPPRDVIRDSQDRSLLWKRSAVTSASFICLPLLQLLSPHIALAEVTEFRGLWVDNTFVG